MSARPDWLLPWFPELRPGPPWVTEEMIAAQPGLARLIDDAAEAATVIADAVVRAAVAGFPIVVAGCGTSEHAAAGIVELLDEALRSRGVPGGRVELRESLEATLDPRPGGVFVGISHGGRSRATIAALEAAKVAGAATVLVTADSQAPAAHEASHLLIAPFRDESFCHTVAYVGAIVAGAAVASAIDGGGVRSEAVCEHVEALLEVEAQARAVAANLHGCTHLLCVGGGADLGAARELALKVEEAARLPATGLGLESVLHGHLVAAGSTTGLVLLLTDRRRRERRADRALAVLRAARTIGTRAALVATADAAERVGPELASAGVVIVPESRDLPELLASLLSSALALQLLTLGLVHEAGVNPDLIRREEAPYREAAEFSETKIR